MAERPVTPTFPRLVNGRFGDPALFVEILYRPADPPH